MYALGGAFLIRQLTEDTIDRSQSKINTIFNHFEG